MKEPERDKTRKRGGKEGGGRIKWEWGSRLKGGGTKSKEKYANLQKWWQK